ncbi:MAG: hypothetical protein ACM3N3_21340, partial [Betaproteobacteria bacterium]
MGGVSTIRPIGSPSSSIFLCAVTQQIQPKLAVTLAQYRERFLNDPMVGGYSFFIDKQAKFPPNSGIQRSPITQVVP